MARVCTTEQKRFIREVGERVAFYRGACVMTQRELAELSGVGERALRAVERGERECQILTIVRLADALGRSCDELLRGAK